MFSIIVGLILEFKKRTGPFNKFFVPIVVTVCWCFFIIPYLVLFPIISAVIPGETDDYELFLKLLIIISALCFMLLNTSIAIILNIILQKIEEEKLTKFVVRFLKRILKQNAVKGVDAALRKLYEIYLKQGAQKVSDLLIRDRRPCLM
jgi:ABC-type anion transport system duplicated permease subunit